MKLYYYHDRDKHKKLNTDGIDYTPAYIPVILKNLGFCAIEITESQLDILQKDDALIIGSDTLDTQKATIINNSGCSVVAFGTKGDIFPKTKSIKREKQYDIVGYFKFNESDEPLPVLESFNEITNCNSLGKIDSKYTAFAKLGNIYYFSFDVIATMLYTADGKPTLEGKNGFSTGRIPDGCVIPDDYDYNIAYNDSYLRKIEDILHQFGFASIFALPVNNDRVCDMVLYFAGDDDAHSLDNDIFAAREMQKRGLPYHINIMPKDEDGNFVVSKEDVETLHSLGCETAIHYDFTRFPYSPEGHKLQMQMYEKAIGKSGGPINHCLVQAGNAPERYMMQIECGAKYDNNRFQNKVDPNNINAFNLIGYGFGHAFPRFVMADAKNGNLPLEFCEVYMSYYEPRIIDCTPDEYKKVADYLDDSYKYARTSQLFTHPHYISGKTKNNPEYALRALDYMKEYVTQKGWNVWFTAPDALGEWWHSRAKCEISDVSQNGFIINNTTNQTVSVVLPFTVKNAIVDKNPANITHKKVGERQLQIICVDSGIHTVQYKKE